MSKTAIITGGSRGLGRVTALRLAEQGVDIIFTYNSRKDMADEVTAAIEKFGRKAESLQLDVSDSKAFAGFADSVKKILGKWGKDSFEYLVNNAGVGLYMPFAETTEEQFDNLVNIHLKAPYFLTQRLLPIMSDGGRIVNISSGLARFSMPGASAYGTMKAGLDTLTRYMAKELGERKISAIAFAPGAIETDFGGGRVRDVKEVNDMISSVTALGRAGLPEDVGGAIAALLSDDCTWINGQRIEASGGMFL